MIAQRGQSRVEQEMVFDFRRSEKPSSDEGETLFACDDNDHNDGDDSRDSSHFLISSLPEGSSGQVC